MNAGNVTDVTTGVIRAVVDGQDTTLMDPLKRIQAANLLASQRPRNNALGMTITQLKSPGCGG